MITVVKRVLCHSHNKNCFNKRQSSRVQQEFLKIKMPVHWCARYFQKKECALTLLFRSFSSLAYSNKPCYKITVSTLYIKILNIKCSNNCLRTDSPRTLLQIDLQLIFFSSPFTINFVQDLLFHRICALYLRYNRNVTKVQDTQSFIIYRKKRLVSIYKYVQGKKRKCDRDI